MNRFKVLGVLAASCLGVTVGACSDTAQGPSGPGLKIQTAPLNLPGVGNACYTIIVTNADDEPVWQESNICAQSIAGGPAYGNANGSITYIGTCDADDGDLDNPAQADNTVQLILEGIYDTTGAAITEFENPCNATAGANNDPTCFKTIPCVENADALVQFNITLMREANQGFFDVAVNFQDLFCSAKLDCEYADGTPIELLFNGTDRDATAVLAFACTSGSGGSETNLYMNDVSVECWTEDADTLEVAPLELGNQGGSVDVNVFDYAVYAGAEQLTGYNKGYWNVAIGFDTTGWDAESFCIVSTRATASESPLASNSTPSNTAYPVINFNVTIGADAEGNLDCGAHPLNGAGSGVQTVYSTVTSTGECFDNSASVAAGSLTVSNDTFCVPTP